MGTVQTYADTKDKFSVTFINPGVSDESDPTGSFWLMVSSFMEATAIDLNIELEILYAERKFVHMIEFAKEIAARENKPDYIILVNEKLIASQLLEILDDTGCKVLLILNDLTTEQKKTTGGPREKYENWIGSIIPDNVDAGYQIANQIIQEGQNHINERMEIIALSGNRVTPASVDRTNGLQKAIREYGDQVVLRQIVYGEWREDEAYLKTKVLLKRYPKTTLIWAANDPMAFGAMRAAEEVGKIPGETVFIGGLNWSNEALEKIQDGRLVTSVGGHFMVGGWGLVMLYDYHNKIDFAQKPWKLNVNLFEPINSTTVDQYLEIVGDENWGKINFNQYSKKLNPQMTDYIFKLKLK